MIGINGHTCIKDDGGTPNRRCDACDAEREAEQRATHGRKGIDHWHAKLTENDIRRIRSLVSDYGMRLIDLANIYGVSRATIAAIVARRRWRHVE
jgi:hypothetical protein